jgi:transcription elongation factor GreA
VAEDEADISKNRLSIQSPIGKALLGHKAGETVDVRVPAGIIPYEILKITRQ